MHALAAHTLQDAALLRLLAVCYQCHHHHATHSNPPGVKHLAGISSLHSLQLPNAMKISAGSIQELSKFTALRNLNLRGCSQLLDAHMLQLLQRLTLLQTLNLQSCSGLTGSFLPEVCSRLVHLQTLNLAYCPGLYPGQLAYLSALPALQQLDVTGGSAVSGIEVLLLLGKLQHLTQLQGGHWRCKGSVASLATFLDSSSSRSSSRATDAGEAAAEQQQQQRYALLPAQLQHLSVSHLSCSESFLQVLLLSLPSSLTALDLSSCSGFGKDSNCLQGLQDCKQLRSLNLSGSSGRLAESALQYLSELSCLTELQLDHIDHSSSSGSGGASECAAAGASSSDVLGGDAPLGNASGSSSRASSMSCSQGVSSQSSSSDGSSSSRGVSGVAGLLAGTDMVGSPTKHMLAANTSRSANGGEVLPVRRSLFAEAAEAGAAAIADFLQYGSPAVAEEAGPELMYLQDCQQQQQQLPRLAHMQQLQHLTISFSTWVDDSILAGLSGLTNLRSVSIISCHRFSGVGFGSWGSMRDLTRLNLSGCGGVSDAGCAALARECTGLKQLVLAGCKAVGDAGVAELAQLRWLRQLNLTSNRSITHRWVMSCNA
jgi:hypothetical protein